MSSGTYFAQDGSFGDARGLVILELDALPQHQIDYLIDLPEEERHQLACKVAATRSDEFSEAIEEAMEAESMPEEPSNTDGMTPEQARQHHAFQSILDDPDED